MHIEKLFTALQKINHRPKPYEHYTTDKLWCDPYISKQMLSLHISEDVELASRKKDFIDRSAKWILDYFKIENQSKICDFGCGPGLYTTKFAQCGAAVTGIDFSKNSIDYAIAESKRNNLNIEYVLQDYLTFETDNKFDLITMIYCDFCALNPNQRAKLLKKFHSCLKNSGSILLDVFSFAEYDAKREESVYEYSKKMFWSRDPYYVFQSTFKYEEEHVSLDKFTIVEKSKTREIYNWLQYYNLQTVSKELQQNGFKIAEHFANVAGDPFAESMSEFAIIAKKNKHEL